MIRLIPAMVALIAAAGCHFAADAEERDAGPQTSRSYQVGAFDRIAVAGPYDVRVVSGGQAGVSAVGGANMLDETEVVVDDGTLEIRPKQKRGIRWNWGRTGKAVFTVNAAALRGAAIAGSGDIDIDRVDGDFEGEIAGSGGLRLASVTGGRIKFDVAGSGEVSATGKADSVEVSIAGSGDVDARSLASRTAEVSIAGSGNVRANASETADVSIMGSGDVELTGGAKCSVSKAGSGNVRCG